MQTTELKQGDVVTYADFKITAALDHNNEPILMAETEEGRMIIRTSPSERVDLYSAQLCNTVNAYVESGDFVRCNDCDKLLLLPTDADMCPKCKAVKRFSWVNNDKHLYDYDAILALKCHIKSCQKLDPEQYLSEEAIKQQQSKK